MIVNRHKEARCREDSRQEYNNRYADGKTNAQKNEIKVVDYILVKQPKTKKALKQLRPMQVPTLS